MTCIECNEPAVVSAVLESVENNYCFHHIPIGSDIGLPKATSDEELEQALNALAERLELEATTLRVYRDALDDIENKLNALEESLNKGEYND